MNISKKQFEYVILDFAKMYGNEKNFEYILKTATLPEIVKMIIHLMFLHKFDYRSCSEVEYNNYLTIYEYSIELNEKGWVDFK